MRVRTTTTSVAAALALMAVPAFAEKPPTAGQGKTTAPGQLCKTQSHKKTNHGKGKSPYAACVSGAKKQVVEAKKEPNPSEQRSPAQMCKTESRKKDSDDQKSPFAACVVGVTETRKAQREAEQS